MPNHTLSHQNFKQKHPVRRKTWFDWTTQSHTKLLQVAAIVISYVRPQVSMRSVVQILGRLCYHRDLHLWHSLRHRDVRDLVLDAAQHGPHRALPFPMLMGPQRWTEKDNPHDHSMSFADPHVNMSRPWNMEAHMEHIAGFLSLPLEDDHFHVFNPLDLKNQGTAEGCHRKSFGAAVSQRPSSPATHNRQHQTLMEYQPWSYSNLCCHGDTCHRIFARIMRRFGWSYWIMGFRKR